jgi:hypothetical protein
MEGCQQASSHISNGITIVIPRTFKNPKPQRLGLQIFNFGNIHTVVKEKEAPIELCQTGFLAVDSVADWTI